MRVQGLRLHRPDYPEVVGVRRAPLPVQLETYELRNLGRAGRGRRGVNDQEYREWISRWHRTLAQQQIEVQSAINWLIIGGIFCIGATIMLIALCLAR